MTFAQIASNDIRNSWRQLLFSHVCLGKKLVAKQLMGYFAQMKWGGMGLIRLRIGIPVIDSLTNSRPEYLLQNCVNNECSMQENAR